MALTQVSTGGIKDGQVQTADLADGQVTASKLHADALDRTYTLGASGNNHYTFTGEGLTGAVNDPTLYLTRGKTYRFVNGNSSGAHPFRIQTTVNGSAGTEYNTGVTNNGGAGGSTIVFEVPHDAPDVLYYQCTSHNAMGGIFYITGALADGGVTTAKIAADAVTTAKIANNAVTTAKIAADAVTSTQIADNTIVAGDIADATITLDKLAHGTSSNDGKFLRANNGADPTFESLPASGVTVSNNADNRVVTGDGTNLNAEANLFFDGSRLGVGTTSPNTYAIATFNDSNGISLTGSTQTRIVMQHANGGTDLKNFDIQTSDGNLRFRTIGDNNTTVTERVRIQSGGGISFNGDTAAANALDDYEEGTYTPTFTHGFDPSPSYAVQAGFYRKVGTLVSFSFYLQLASGSQDTDGGRIKVSLPFNQMSSTYVRGYGIITFHNVASAYPNSDLPSLYIYGNNAEFYSTNGTGFTGGNGSNQASRYIIGGGTYYSA